MNAAQRSPGQQRDYAQVELENGGDSHETSRMKNESVDEEYDLEENTEIVYLMGKGNPNGNGDYQLQRYVPKAAEDHPSFVAAKIQSKLQQKLGPEYISHRAGPGGSKLSYVEGHKVIELANEIFGFDGWSSKIVSCETLEDEKTSNGRYCVCIRVTTNVTLRNGASHEDIGFGSVENLSSHAQALEKAHKEAATDSLKRVLRLFGNALGNSLYDKNHTANVSRMKTNPPAFDPNNLKRAPETDLNSSKTVNAAEHSRPATNAEFVPKQSIKKPEVLKSIHPTTPKRILPAPIPQKPFEQASPVQNRPMPVSAAPAHSDNERARQERLRQAIAKREELRMRKEQAAKELSGAKGLQTAPTINATTTNTANEEVKRDASLKNHEQQHSNELDEFANDLEDVTSSQLMALSDHDSGRTCTNPSSLEKVPTFKGSPSTPTSIISSVPSFPKTEPSLPSFSRGGVVESGNRNVLEGSLANIPYKRPKRFA